MNWLAHLYLYERTTEFRIGSILPDIVSTTRLTGISPEVMQGIERHRDVDVFTDAHPVFKRSLRRFSAPLRIYAGILTDIIYDHFLTVKWEDYSAVELKKFTAEVNSAFEVRVEGVPAKAYSVLDRISKTDLLGSYGTIQGVRTAFDGIRNLLSRPFDTDMSIDVLENKYELFAADFDEYFPLLEQNFPINCPWAGRSPKVAH
ncbi:MAG: DUF479 domain-containing protein [Lentisphaerae bacterium]|nr:DUF479 domain-containing protein [Lentisphaerota bacterium]